MRLRARNPWPADREQGSRDWRLLPLSAALWLAMIVCFEVLDGEAGEGRLPWLMLAVGVSAVLIGGVICCMACLAGCGRRRGELLGQAAMMLLSVIVALCACAAHHVAERRSPTYELLAGSDAVPVVMTVRLREPPLTSDRRSADCRADATVESVATDLVASADYVPIRVYAAGDACAIRQDGLYRMAGVLERPEIGSAKAWLTVDEGTVPSTIEPPGTMARLVYAMQCAFIRNTQRLDDQGSVLMPGITLGLPGQDVADPSMRAGTERMDPVYAQQVEDAFRAAGIMHLMAVSGGHFVIVAGLARRLCAVARAPRCVTACVVSGATVMLMRMMVPADSVGRAACMGMIGVCATLAGRRGQGMSMLCLTVVGTLILFPDASRSIGFALSCAAVLGIVWWNEPLARVCGRHMPTSIAQTLSMTLSAQALALPVMVLVEPELPTLSIVANLLVGPIVTVTTLLGLAALAVSWWWPDAGFVLVWLGSGGTRVMERIAWWCAHAPVSVIPWFSGPMAAAALLLSEGLVVGAVRAWMSRRRDERYAPGIVRRMGEWMSETLRMLSSDAA